MLELFWGVPQQSQGVCTGSLRFSGFTVYKMALAGFHRVLSVIFMVLIAQSRPQPPSTHTHTHNCVPLWCKHFGGGAGVKLARKFGSS